MIANEVSKLLVTEVPGVRPANGADITQAISCAEAAINTIHSAGCIAGALASGIEAATGCV
eukprot:4271606-Amphidinium_carterae.1